MEQTTKTSGKNREMILLIVVAFIGTAGLLVLQFARKTPTSRTDERSLVQSGQKEANPAAVSAPIQTIPGNLISRNEEYPEVGQPFVFRMANFSQGATYELDMGDGSGRKTFTNGALRYTYQRSGEFQVTLYAKFEGQEVKLQTVTKKVVVSRKPERVEVVPIIDN